MSKLQINYGDTCLTLTLSHVRCGRMTETIPICVVFAVNTVNLSHAKQALWLCIHAAQFHLEDNWHHFPVLPLVWQH